MDILEVNINLSVYTFKPYQLQDQVSEEEEEEEEEEGLGHTLPGRQHWVSNNWGPL